MLAKTLQFIEQKGNQLPSPTMLFIWLAAAVLIISSLAALFGVSAVHPVTGQTLVAVNLISEEGLHKILTQTVTNFIHFAPVGTVLVAIMGIGIAEHSGLINTLLKATVLKAPKQYMSFAVVVCGVLSSLAADSGYVVLIPLAALIYLSLGRHPLIGIAAAFAGVSGGFSANLIIGPFDTALAGITTEAAKLVDDRANVSATANYYFIFVSTFFIGVIGALITEKVVAPRLKNQPYSYDHKALLNPIQPQQKKALYVAGLVFIIIVLLILMGLTPTFGYLLSEKNTIIGSPFMKGIVTVIAVTAAICGIVYGKVSGEYKKVEASIAGMEQHMATMAGYLVLMFFAAQFVQYFAWSQLGSILAINGASVLSALNMPLWVVMLCFILLAALINLFIGSGSGKWALLAPVFVPMLLLTGLPPETTQMAYRIGDSATNIITPLMPYFGVVVAFAQKYNKDIGLGTLVSTMLPYSIAFLVGWTLLLILWVVLGLPLGPQG